MQEQIKSTINKLKYSSIQVEYNNENLDTDSQWIYFPDPCLRYHRILVRHNFCSGSRGYWTETNSERVDLKNQNNKFSYMNKYAYPLNTINKPAIMKQLLEWCEKYSIYGLGRWGEHQHYNSDLTVELALKLSDRLVK